MRAGLVAAGAALLLALAAPLYFALVASLTPEDALFAAPSWLPRQVVLAHYRALFEEQSFWLPIRNSLLVAAGTSLLCVGLGAACAYALVRLRLPGRALWLAALLAVGLFPQIALVSPLYLVLRGLGWIDRLPGLVVPYLSFSLPLAVWLLAAAFRELPRELEEAAWLDGASRLRALREVVLPLARPALVATGLVTFLYCWNEFLFALSFTIGSDHHTVPVAIALFRGQYRVPWGQVLAAAVLATAPVAALVLAFQRRIVRGLTAGAIKG